MRRTDHERDNNGLICLQAFNEARLCKSRRLFKPKAAMETWHEMDRKKDMSSYDIKSAYNLLYTGSEDIIKSTNTEFR